jgi:hypothetical protein
MNVKLVESLAQIILSLSEAERQLLESQIHPSELGSKIDRQIPQDFLELENRLQAFEGQYQMRSEDFYRRFRAGELGDSMDFFEWSVFYEMWKDGNQELKLLQAQGV